MDKDILDALHHCRNVTTPIFAEYVEEFISVLSSASQITEEMKKESLDILSAACYNSTPKSAEYFREVIKAHYEKT